jgi:replication factor A1
LLYTVNSLVEGAKGVTIRLRVVTVSDPRTVKTRDGEPHRVVDVQVGDWTGMTKLSLWDEMVDLLNAGDLIDVENGYVTLCDPVYGPSHAERGAIRHSHAG